MAKNILVTDDATFMRLMLKDILVKNGYNVIGEAQNGIEAVDKYKELNEMYLAAQKIGDQDTLDKVSDARDTAYKELQEANNKYASYHKKT